jgi:uncharacterized protein YciI
MLFVIICHDKPGYGDVRHRTRERHFAFLQSTEGVVKVGGPLLAEDGETMIGSMLIIEAADQKAAETWASEDPYRKAGLFESVEIRPWKWVVGAPEAA